MQRKETENKIEKKGQKKEIKKKDSENEKVIKKQKQR